MEIRFGRRAHWAAAVAVGVALSAGAEPEWASKLDHAPVWKDVKTVYYDTLSDPGFTVKGEYFKGKFVSAADDNRAGSRKFFLRRAFTLPSKPVKAYFQAMGDDTATFSLNGEKVFTFRYSNEPYAPNSPSVGEVAAKLKAGENLLTADYSISIDRRMGGVLLELLVFCEGGEVVRIDSDGQFESSADGQTWKGVSLFDPPPAPPRLSRISYRDFAHPRQYFGGAPSKASVAAGERITLGYTFGGTAPKGTFTVRVSLRKGSSCYWAEEIDVKPSAVTKLGDGKWRMDVPFETPLYIHSGEYTLDMNSNSLFCPSQDRFGFNLTIAAPKAIPGFPKPLTVEMKKREGYPTMYVDGRPTALLWGGVDAGRRADCKPRHSDTPLTAVSVYQYYWQWHPKMGEYDFSWFDRKAELYRRSNPDAYYIWDLTIYPAGDFAQKYPEEMASDDTGDRAPVGRFSWSFASKRGMAEMKEIIEKAITYVENSPYANRVIGYRVNSGVTIEWLGWDAKPGRVKDFSEPNKKAFREFAAKHYPDLADPHVPDLAERNALDGEFDILWDQRKHLNAIAYMDYNSWIIAQDILETSGHAKKVLAGLGRTKIVGTYYGYSWYLNCSGRDQRRGHFALQHLLDDNNGTVDFLMSPNSYAERNLGETCGDMKPFATLAAAGVMSVMEDDTRTHNRKWPMWLDYNQTHNPEQTRAVIARNGSVVLCHRSSPYFYSLCTGYDSDSPECAEVGRAFRTVMDFRYARPGGRHAEIALVESEKSQTAIPGLSRAVRTGFWTQSYGPDGEVLRREQKTAIYNGEINCNAQSRFARSGAPVDLLLAEDLKNSAGDYRLYVFYNVLKYDRTMLEAVRKLRERGATLVWLYAPGYLNGNSLESMRELTGMAFEEIEGGGIAAVTVREDGRLMGSPDAQVAKLFAPTDADVVLGTYANGKPGLAAKKTGKSVSFFSGAWQLDQKFIAELVRRSRAHVYCTSGDPMEADDSLFTLHARNPGRKTVTLPRKVAAVVDVFNKRIVARDTDTFAFDAPLHTTHLFYYGDDGDELLARLRRNDMNHE